MSESNFFDLLTTNVQEYKDKQLEEENKQKELKLKADSDDDEYYESIINELKDEMIKCSKEGKTELNIYYHDYRDYRNIDDSIIFDVMYRTNNSYELYVDRNMCNIDNLYKQLIKCKDFETINVMKLRDYDVYRFSICEDLNLRKNKIIIDWENKYVHSKNIRDFFQSLIIVILLSVLVMCFIS